MSDYPPDSGLPEPGQPETGQPGADTGARSASVQLRRTGSGVDASTRGVMDPANKSLTDALRISFVMLQLGMILLGVLWVISGFHSVRENERGISVRFGKPTDRSLEPGGHLSWPHPLGEMVPIDVGTITVPIDLPFFVRPRRSGEGQDDFDFAPDRLPRPRSLNPAQHGSLITADGAIAHTRWQVVYRRADHFAYAENVHPGSERAIVTMAVQRGVVHAVATTTIDDLLKQSAGENAGVARVARRLAQDSLDTIGSGLRIDNLYMVDKIPPTALIEDFNAVARAESEAGQRREVAEQTRRTSLNQMAGPAAEAIVEAIEDYEIALAAEDDARAEAVLERVFTLLEEGAVDTETAVPLPVSGRVARIIERARVDSDSAVRGAEAQALLFEAQIAQFNANPKLMIQRAWSQAFIDFMGREDIDVWRAPDNGTGLIELVLNRDPEQVQAANQAIKARQAQESYEARERGLYDARD